LELLTTLRRAVWDDRRLRIRYEDRNRKSSTRSVEPLGLVSKAGVWYLIARYGGELRSFRVDRVRSAQELGEHFARPEDFDLERYWAESSARFSEASRSADCMVTLRAANDALERITYYWPAEVLSQDANEALVRVTFPGIETALFQALAWADVATLVEPAALRDEIVARARLALTRYALR
jgi:predicted DNA-binding transcriptional regulator YafY